MRLSTLGMQTEQDLVTPRHERWLRENGDGAAYSEWALIFAEEQLRSRGRNRTGSYSASSLGGCARRQQLVFRGEERNSLRPRQIQVSHNGVWMHLRWQMAGLTAGWLAQAEVPIPANRYGLMGTMDGVLDTGEGLELKSANKNAFSGVKSFGIKEEHDFQVHTYMLATGIETFSVIYESKDTQEWHEIVRHRDEKTIARVIDRAEMLQELDERHELAPMIDKCAFGEGWRYEWCELRESCARAGQPPAATSSSAPS